MMVRMVMRMIKNEKGFTLVELLATVLILALLVGIGTYSITRVINNSKKKNMDLLIGNIQDGAEIYYNECKYGGSELEICNKESITLGDLVDNDFITGNGKDADTGNEILVNPNTNKLIGDCVIGVSYNDGRVVITNLSYDRKECPRYDR